MRQDLEQFPGFEREGFEAANLASARKGWVRSLLLALDNRTMHASIDQDPDPHWLRKAGHDRIIVDHLGKEGLVITPILLDIEKM